MVDDVPVSPDSAAARRDAGLAAVSWEKWSREYDRMTFGECVRRIREDYVAHGRDWTLPGFRTIAVYRFGNWRMNVRSKILRAPFSNTK